MARIGATRALSPVASLSPTIIGWRERATVVSTDMSTPGQGQGQWSGSGSGSGSWAGAGAGAGVEGAELWDEQARPGPSVAGRVGGRGRGDAAAREGEGRFFIPAWVPVRPGTL